MTSRTLYTALVSFVVALGGFLLGFDSAVISGAVPFIKDYFILSDLALGWSVSCLIFGAMAGNAVAGPLSDRMGRKPVLIVTAVLFALSALASALATDFWFFIAARILGGVGVGMALLIAPIYIAEVAPPERRGQLVSFNQLNIVIGISVAYWSNYFLLGTGEHNWRWMLGVEMIPAILYFLFLFTVPRSPRWLAQKERDGEALEVLERVGGATYAERSLASIKEHLGVATERVGFSALFTRRMSFIMFIAVGIAFFQQITGINAIFYYAPTIFEKTGGGTQAAFMQAIVIGLVNLGFTFVAIWAIDRFGRRPLLLIGTAVMALSLFVNAAAFYAADYVLTDSTLVTLGEELPPDVVGTLEELRETEFQSKDAFLAAVEKRVGPVVRGQYRLAASANDDLEQVLAAGSVTSRGDLIAALTGAEGGSRRILKDKLPPEALDGLLRLGDEPFPSSAALVAAWEQEVDEATLGTYLDEIENRALDISAPLVLLAIVGYIAAFAVSLGPVMWALLSEIFPNRLRGLAISFVGLWNSLVSFSVTLVFPWELTNLGASGTFLIYGVFAALAFVFTALWIPETKGKSLEELETVLARAG